MSAPTAISSAIFRRAGRNGTGSTATRCAASGRATTDWSPRWPRASSAPPTSSAIAAAGRGRASTSSPPMTALRCRIWSATSRKHNEANGEDNRDGHDAEFQLELRRRRPERRSRDPRPARPAEAQPAGHAAVVARRADAARRRRVRAQPTGQQQRLLPGQRDLLARLAEDPARKTRRCAVSCAI